MKVLIDTNVIIDVLAKREGFYEYSLKILHFCEAHKADGFICASSVTDIMYILRKNLPVDSLRKAVKTLLAVIDVADVTKADINNAFNLGMTDFEDAVLSACAKRIKADYIITRNAKDFINSPVEAVTPARFFELMR